MSVDPLDKQTEPQELWDIERLAAYLHLKPSTLRVAVSRSPDRLPQRVPGKKPLWHPKVVEAWAMGAQQPKKKGGRPRNPVT